MFVQVFPVDVFCYVIDGSAKTNGRCNGRRARFKLERRRCPGGMLQANFLNHRAAELIWLDVDMMFFIDVQNTNTGGTKQLVTAKGQKVCPQLLHVNMLVRNALGGVNEHKRTVVLRYRLPARIMPDAGAWRLYVQQQAGRRLDTVEAQVLVPSAWQVRERFPAAAGSEPTSFAATLDTDAFFGLTFTQANP